MEHLTNVELVIAIVAIAVAIYGMYKFIKLIAGK